MRRSATRLAAGVALASGLLVLVGCAHKARPLYQWGAFPQQQYSTLLREGASPDEQIRTLEAHAEKVSAKHWALPPGYRAHLGMLYLGAGNPQRAQELWTAEKTAFPESTPYMDQLLKRLDSPAPASKTDKPA